MRILIADDHELVRKGLKQILLEKFSFAHIEEAGNGKVLVEKAIHGKWDIVITDIAMPLLNGIEALRQLKTAVPTMPVLVISIHAEEQYAVQMLRAGAAGYLCKDVASDELVKAVQLLLQGRRYIPASVAERLAADFQKQVHRLQHDSLSQREKAVFHLLAQGKSVTEISILLSIGVTTVSTYRARILKKMSLKTNADLVRYAIDQSLL